MYRHREARVQDGRARPWNVWRFAGALVMLGVVLATASCRASTTPGGQPTATAKPSVTPSTPPCASWRIIPSANATRYQMNTLSGVSALTPSAAWAVGGNYAETGPVSSLIERWDGTSWQIATSAGDGFLTGVAAITPSDVWAVGSVSASNSAYVTPNVLIEHWNGTQWTFVPAANTGSASATLKSVVARASNDVWAVGGSEAAPLVERWDGATWRVVGTPTPNGAAASSLNALAAIPGGQQFWAVGAVQYASSTGTPNYTQLLIERWDGAAWHIIGEPALPSGAFGGELNGVVALSSTDAWAVGSYTASDHTVRTLIAHWNGAGWQVASGPDTAGSLTGVAAVGAHDVRAVGHVFSDGRNLPPLAQQWDGATWRAVSMPAPNGASGAQLSGIVTDSAGNYWAVGSARNADHVLQTLTVHCS